MTHKPFPVSLNSELIVWINENFKKEGFRNKSHFVEFAINEFKKKINGSVAGDEWQSVQN